MVLSGEEEQFLKEGVARFVPAVKALSDFVECCRSQLRDGMQPHDEVLQELKLAHSGDRFYFGPGISEATESESLWFGVRIPERSGFYVELYPQEQPEESMWLGGWFWPKSRATREQLTEVCKARCHQYGLVFESERDGTVYLGTYADLTTSFPSFAPKLSETLDQVTKFLREVDFKGQFSSAMDR